MELEIGKSAKGSARRTRCAASGSSSEEGKEGEEHIEAEAAVAVANVDRGR